MWKQSFVIFGMIFGLVGCSNILQAEEVSDFLVSEKESKEIDEEVNNIKGKSTVKNTEQSKDNRKNKAEFHTKEASSDKSDQKKPADTQEEKKEMEETEKATGQTKKSSKQSSKDTKQNSKDNKQIEIDHEKSHIHKKTKKQHQENGQPNVSTVELLLPNSHSELRKTPVTHIVIHFSSYAAIKPENPYNVDDLYKTFQDYGVSAHYLIDRGGEIYHMVPENRVAYHAGKGHLDKFPEYKDRLNHYSIGIEIMAIGTEEEMLPMMSADHYREISHTHIGYTNAQYETVRKLVDDIVSRHPHVKKDRDHIVGHDEYAKGRKTDPGSLFDWSKIGF